MDISGSLHVYSGKKKRELVFVFDDDVAQVLYKMDEFDIDESDTRRVYICIGDDRFIHHRTMSFSKKQSEIKVSLCSLATKDGLQSLTALYDWFAPSTHIRLKPFPILGTLERRRHNDADVWEIRLSEPLDLVTPRGLPSRTKAKSGLRRAWEHRRLVYGRDLSWMSHSWPRDVYHNRPARESLIQFRVESIVGPFLTVSRCEPSTG
jgi:hypothetical protein